MIFETEHLIIRKLKIEDAKDFFEYAKQPDIGSRAGGWEPYKNLTKSKEILQLMINAYENLDKEQTYAIVFKENEKMIGTIGYSVAKEKQVEKTEILKTFVSKKIAYIGYVLSNDYAGNNYMTETVKGFVDHLFYNQFDIVMAICSSENFASEKVLKNNDFVLDCEIDTGKKWHNTDCTLEKTYFIQKVFLNEENVFKSNN